MDKEKLVNTLMKNGFTIQDGKTRITAEKDGYRLTILLSADGEMVSAIEEKSDTSACVKLVASAKHGVSLTCAINDSEIIFTRKDAISETELRY